MRLVRGHEFERMLMNIEQSHMRKGTFSAFKDYFYAQCQVNKGSQLILSTALSQNEERFRSWDMDVKIISRTCRSELNQSVIIERGLVTRSVLHIRCSRTSHDKSVQACMADGCRRQAFVTVVKRFVTIDELRRAHKVAHYYWMAYDA